MGVALRLRRFPKHVDVRITMPMDKILGGVDGECGNLDGIAENDGESDVRERMGSITVDDSMLLFATKFLRSSTSISEEDYQAVAVSRDDDLMKEFVERVLEAENKTVPQDQTSELEGFVPWFSGSMAVQSLKALKEELSNKSWVKEKNALAPHGHGDYEYSSGGEDADNGLNEVNDEEVPIPHDYDDGEGLEVVKELLDKNFALNASLSSKHHKGRHDEDKIVFEKELVGESPVGNTPAIGDHSDDVAVDASSSIMSAITSVGDDLDCSQCLLWGASHILSFNAFRKHAAQHPKREAMFRAEDWQQGHGQLIDETGTYWLVKSQHVHIQGSFWFNMSGMEVLNLGALTVGGPFLEGKTLFIRGGEVRWNREKIVRELPSDFSNEFVRSEYLPWVELISCGMLGPGLEFKFRNGMSLVVNYHHRVLDAKITMCGSQGGFGVVEGHCGNFDVGQGAADAVRLEANVKLDNDQIIAPFGSAKPIKVGDRVRVRDSDDDEWLLGNVTSLNPLNVMPDYYDIEFPWKTVERI